MTSRPTARHTVARRKCTSMWSGGSPDASAGSAARSSTYNEGLVRSHLACVASNIEAPTMVVNMVQSG
jgi:hypothetical protein